MKKILVATGNQHKTGEIRAILGEGWLVEELSNHPHLPSPMEDGATFSDNATIKALAASRELPGMLVLSDDSGLEADALNGAPGVISARYAGAGATDADNRGRLKRELRALVERGISGPFTARFRCCMVLAQNGNTLGEFYGAVEGRLLLEEMGTGGFGYDSLFVPDGYANTFGVLSAEIKNGLSHRARALEKLVSYLNES